MADAYGMSIATIEGGSVAADGSGLAMVATVTTGDEVVVTFPYEQLLALVALAAMGRTDCKRKRGFDPNDDADILVTTQFDLGTNRKSGMAVIMFSLTNGAKLTFSLPDPLPARIHAILGQMLDGEVVRRDARSLVN